MRLVIDSRASAVAGLKRYNGEGIFSSIGRKVLLSGLKKVVNSIETKNRWQKIADVVVNGHQRQGQNTSSSSSSDQVLTSTRKRGGVKRKSLEQHSPLSSSQQSLPKARKYSNSTIDKLINSGAGIILD